MRVGPCACGAWHTAADPGEVPTLTLYTRRVDQGQAVEVSYGYDTKGSAYKRVVDQGEPLESPDRVRWWRGEIDWDHEPEGIDYDRAPCVKEWTPCEEPSDV
jgi:hypothetical protein